MEREKMLESKRRYFKKYYQEHKDYYKQKSEEQRKKMNCSSVYKYKLNKGLDYIENEIFCGKEDMAWHRRNGGCISGSDLPCEVILDLYDILKGGRK